MEYKIGISMRVTNAINYDEPRDTIARDWSNYMMSAFPESKWLFIPNIGTNAIEFIQKWDINVLILSGGDNIGRFPERDETEFELLKYALKNSIRIIAVCRGLQLVHSFFGGKIIEGDSSFIINHRANEHFISLNNKTYNVNSYHNNRIVESTLHKEFEVIGHCISDNSVECIKSDQILGMMWHPERDKNYPKWNQNLIVKFLKNEL